MSHGVEPSHPMEDLTQDGALELYRPESQVSGSTSDGSHQKSGTVVYNTVSLSPDNREEETYLVFTLVKRHPHGMSQIWSR